LDYAVPAAMNPLLSGVEYESSGDAVGDAGCVQRFCGGCGNGGTVYLCCVAAAVYEFPASGDDYGRLGFVSGWGAAGTAGGTKVSRAVGFDWGGFADGNCEEKFDFVGRLGDGESAVRQADVRGDAGRGGGAVAADFDDDDGDDSWELALGKQTHADNGDGGNWRFDDFWAADSGGDSGGFYLHGWLANLDF